MYQIPFNVYFLPFPLCLFSSINRLKSKRKHKKQKETKKKQKETEETKGDKRQTLKNERKTILQIFILFHFFSVDEKTNHEEPKIKEEEVDNKNVENEKEEEVNPLDIAVNYDGSLEDLHLSIYCLQHPNGSYYMKITWPPIEGTIIVFYLYHLEKVPGIQFILENFVCVTEQQYVLIFFFFFFFHSPML